MPSANDRFIGRFSGRMLAVGAVWLAVLFGGCSVRYGGARGMDSMIGIGCRVDEAQAPGITWRRFRRIGIGFDVSPRLIGVEAGYSDQSVVYVEAPDGAWHLSLGQDGEMRIDPIDPIAGY